MTPYKKYHVTLFFVTQLFGSACRGSFLCTCRAVLLTDPREVQHCEFCTEKENCRRKQMLRALGSDEPLLLDGQWPDAL